MSATYSPGLPTEQSPSADPRRTQSPSCPAQGTPERDDQIQHLKKELHDKDSTIDELKTQLRNLQTIVERLTKENSVLKTSSIDDDSVTSLTGESCSGLDGFAAQERGKSLESELGREVDVRPAKGSQRPVSMYETREGPKNNWQVTKHQVLIIY